MTPSATHRAPTASSRRPFKPITPRNGRVTKKDPKKVMAEDHLLGSTSA